MEQHPIKTNNNLATNQPQSNLLGLLLPKPGQDFNVNEFIRAQSSLTISQALNTPQVSKINKEYPQHLAAAIAQLLGFINKLFNLPENKKLNDPQIALLATDIRTRYWFLKFDELVYILREGVAGKWGKSYSRIDTEVIHAWFQAYIQTERDAVIEQASYNQAIQFKKQENAQPQEVKPMPEHIQKELEALRSKLEHDAVKQIKQEAPVLTHNSYLEQLNSCIADLELPELQELHREAQTALNPEVAKIVESELTKRGEGFKPFQNLKGNAA